MSQSKKHTEPQTENKCQAEFAALANPYMHALVKVKCRRLLANTLMFSVFEHIFSPCILKLKLKNNGEIFINLIEYISHGTYVVS